MVKKVGLGLFLALCLLVTAAGSVLASDTRQEATPEATPDAQDENCRILEEENMSERTLTTDTGEWVLLWADEFDGEAGTPVNGDNWTHELGGWGWGNNEREFYTNSTENSALDGSGCLAITARVDESRGHACHYGLCEYTSARLISHGHIDFTYGRVEARLKLPRGQGVWPAFWMLGSNIGQVGWPQSGEIDIMEYLGHDELTTYGTLHGPGYSGADGLNTPFRADASFSDSFHTFAVEWEEDVIRWYVDDTLFKTLTPDGVPGEWVFDRDFFIIMNVAVGGYWPGFPDETTEFPQTMLVDYVRVYQRPQS